MDYKYRVNGENGSFVEYARIEDVPGGETYETIEIIEEVPVVIVPDKVTAIQFLVQLEIEGIPETAIIATINGMFANNLLTEQQKIMALISLKRATFFEHNHPFVSLIGMAFGKNEQQLDDIFINANKI